MSSIKITSDKMGVASFNTKTVKMKVNFRTSEGSTGGTGIANLVQTTESTEDGGINVWTATMTDGSSREFHVRNGSKGSQGDGGGGSSSTGYIGQYASLEDLQQISASAGMFAYVGTTAPYLQYAYSGTSWVPTGVTVDDIADISGDRDTSYSSKGYVHVQKNIVPKDVVKTYSDVTWVHGVESTARTKSTATAAASYDSATEYFEGNPSNYYGKSSGFPQAGNTSVRKSVPFVVLNKTDNKVYFKWQWNKGSWQYSDIYYDGWGEQPSTMDFTITSGKVFAYVDKGITHYVRWTGSAWETDATESKEINYLSPTAFNKANTIYEIAYDVDLNGGTLTPASGAVLKYAGGKIKNGVIDGTNGNIIIDCPDVEFFQNVRFLNMDSHIMKDVWFDDIFLAMSAQVDGKSPMKGISLSRDYTLNWKYCEFYFKDERVSSGVRKMKFTILGNGHTIKIDTSYICSGKVFFTGRYVEAHDLTINVTNTDLQVFNAIFNIKNADFTNVSYKGYSRFIANWLGDSETDTDTAIVMHGCKVKVSSFAFEHYFYKIELTDTDVSYINAADHQYYEIMSVGTYVSEARIKNNVERGHIEFRNCKIGGPIEILGNYGLDDDGNYHGNSEKSQITTFYSYNYLHAYDCELVRFGFSNSSLSGKGMLKVKIERCSMAVCYLPRAYARMDTVEFIDCNITAFKDNQVANQGGSFCFEGVNEATFRGCTFANAGYHDKDTIQVNGTSYPNGYKFEPMSTDKTFMSYIPLKKDIVHQSSDSADTTYVSGATCDFHLNILGCTIIPNVQTPNFFKIRVISPYGENGTVLMGEDSSDTTGLSIAREMFSFRGTRFAYNTTPSIILSTNSSSPDLGCHAYLNKRVNVLPVDGTTFVASTATGYNRLNYAAANFRYCNSDFDFKVMQASIPKSGRYNAITNKVAWLTYSAEEDVPAT